MIAASLSEYVLRKIFIDMDSPFHQLGFALSLHTDISQIDGSTEIDSPSYARAVIGHGDAYWALGSRVVTNALEVVYPATADDETWPSARSVGLWGLDTNRFLWSVSFDVGSYTVGLGDRLVIPAGGMVIGFG